MAKKSRYKNPNYHRDWKRAHAKEQVEWRRRDYISLHGRARNLFWTCKRRAKIKDWEFNLTVEWIEERILEGCALTGFQFSTKTRNPRMPSVDRMNSKKGYTIDNCRVICCALNMAFNDWGEDVFYDIAYQWMLKTRPNFAKLMTYAVKHCPDV